MYRYHFDVQRGFWLLQFLKFGIFWFTVKTEDSEDMLFDDVGSVEAFVHMRGIDKVYRRIASPIEREPMFFVPGQS